jgi:hypothetical protein
MNKPFALLSILACALPTLSCTNEDGTKRNTVFYPADESPRTGMTQRPQRFGYRGSNNEPDQAAVNQSTRNSRSNRSEVPSDPDGIVKPRDIDPDPGAMADTLPGSTGIPDDTSATGGTGSTPSATAEAPYAEAVPGKYGLVYSPFVADKKKALVNVTDENNVPLPPGTEVQCPLTGKIFRVP